MNKWILVFSLLVYHILSTCTFFKATQNSHKAILSVWSTYIIGVKFFNLMITSNLNSTSPSGLTISSFGMTAKCGFSWVKTFWNVWRSISYEHLRHLTTDNVPWSCKMSLLNSALGYVFTIFKNELSNTKKKLLWYAIWNYNQSLMIWNLGEQLSIGLEIMSFLSFHAMARTHTN